MNLLRKRETHSSIPLIPSSEPPSLLKPPLLHINPEYLFLLNLSLYIQTNVKRIVMNKLAELLGGEEGGRRYSVSKDALLALSEGAKVRDR
jgi:hypothetical protein